MKLIPKRGWVAIEPIQQVETTAGGIHIPESSRKVIDEGEIVEVGAIDEDGLLSDWNIGDRVIYTRYSGTPVKFHPDGVGALGEGKEVRLVDARDLLAKVG